MQSLRLTNLERLLPYRVPRKDLDCRSVLTVMLRFGGTRMIDKGLSAAILAAFLGACSAWSQTIVAAAYTPSTGPAPLYSISPVTGAATPIGPIRASFVSGIAFAPDGITLYGVGQTAAGFSLLSINPLNGAGTSIGLTTLRAPCQDIAFRSDGVLFSYEGGKIFTLSTTTGAATLVGDTGKFPDGNGLACSSGSILYDANQTALDSINQSTAAVT